MEKQDRLDIFINALIQNKSTFSLESFFVELSSRPEAFLYFYENLPPKLQPDFKKQKSRYFRNLFFQVIKEMNDDIFNKYFFDMAEFIDIVDVREESLKRPKNIQLQILHNEKDIPKSSDKIVELLSMTYSADKEKFYIATKKYKMKLVALNKITNTNSRTINYLYTWLNRVNKKEGFLAVLNIVDAMGFKIENMNSNFYNKIDFFNYNLSDQVDQELIDGLDILFKRNPSVPKYKILLNVTDLYNPIRVITSLVERNKKWTDYFWNIYEEYIKDIGAGKNAHVEDLYFKVNNINTFDILKEVIKSREAEKLFRMYNVNEKGNEKIEKIIEDFKILIYQNKVDILDEQLISKAEPSKRNKI